MGHSKAFLKLVDDAKTRIQEISVEEVRRLQSAGEKFYLVDTREDREWEAGHCAGAIHLGRGVLERDIEGVIAERDANIVLYCGGGFRSALAAEMLQKMGYTNVTSMAGGIRDWKDGNHPIEFPE